jgi:hypothetical protein
MNTKRGIESERKRQIGMARKNQTTAAHPLNLCIILGLFIADAQRDLTFMLVTH